MTSYPYNILLEANDTSYSSLKTHELQFLRHIDYNTSYDTQITKKILFVTLLDI
jgi:hypothetical protein